MTEHDTLAGPDIRHDWRLDEVMALFDRPLNDLLFEAQSVHRRHHPGNEVQVSTLLSIKTGGCPEDCKYCPQSIHYETGVETHNLLPVEQVVAAARKAREAGSTRFCMGAAWRSPTNAQVRRVSELVEAVKDLEMETCVTLGMLTGSQARELARAGLDYYNHNLDTSPEYYREIITTRTYEDRLDTLANVRAADIRVCCGGIVGMGESRRDRAGLLVQLANLPEHPESVPHQPARAGRGHPARRCRTAAAARARALHRGRPDPDAPLRRPALRGADRAQRGSAGPLLPRRGGLHLLRRPAPHHPRTRASTRTWRCWATSDSSARRCRAGRPERRLRRSTRFARDRRGAAQGRRGLRLRRLRDLFDVHSRVGRHRARVGEAADSVSATWRSKQLQYTCSGASCTAGPPLRR